MIVRADEECRLALFVLGAFGPYGAAGFGPVVGMHAVKHSMARARQTGIVIAAIRNSNHLGILAPYVEAIAAAGMVGISLTMSEALVHLFGGRKPMIGTNPVAIAVPADPHPLVLDTVWREVLALANGAQASEVQADRCGEDGEAVYPGHDEPWESGSSTGGLEAELTQW